MASSISRRVAGRLIFSGRRGAALGSPSALRRTFTDAVARGPAPLSSFSDNDKDGMQRYKFDQIRTKMRNEVLKNKLYKSFYIHVPAHYSDVPQLINKLPNLMEKIETTLESNHVTATNSAKCTFDALEEYPSIKIVIECDMKNSDDASKRDLDHSIQVFACGLFAEGGFEFGRRFSPPKTRRCRHRQSSLPVAVAQVAATAVSVAAALSVAAVFAAAAAAAVANTAKQGN